MSVFAMLMTIPQRRKGDCHFGDVAKPAEVRRLFDEAENNVGKLDIVVANAGVILEKSLVDSTEEDYDSVFNINTKGVFFTLQEGARRIRDGGRIVAVSTGGTKMPFANLSKCTIPNFALVSENRHLLTCA
jgi:NAD(P)-dependent dehydrogenase (short-subunit alcohol dehydrogenase family)